MRVCIYNSLLFPSDSTLKLLTVRHERPVIDKLIKLLAASSILLTRKKLDHIKDGVQQTPRVILEFTGPNSSIQHSAQLFTQLCTESVSRI